MEIRKKISEFVELTRMYSIGTVLASCAVIFSYAYYSEKFCWLNLILLILALCLLNMGENLYDDLIDVRKKLKKGIKLEDISFGSFVPKARLLINGTYSFEKAIVIVSLLFLIPLLIGVYFLFFAGWEILFFMIFGAILTLFYPYSNKFYLSEIIVALIYGPLMIMGGFYALTSEFNTNLFILSFAVMFATITLLHTHSLMDWEHDISENKKTLCTLSGSKKNALKILKIMIASAFGIIAIGVFLGLFNPYMLYVFLTLPITSKLIDSMRDYINVKDVKFKPKWYYGLFENWNEIKERKIDFFMFRFYLARNFSFFFAIFASIGAMM